MTSDSIRDLAKLLLEPASSADHKYSRGVVGFVTGSSIYPGAALLGLGAAYELGIGMACYRGPRDVTELVLANRPETILGLEKSGVVVIGSGISDDESGEQRQSLIDASRLDVPLVIDAGALQIVDFDSLTAPAILTPHVGEAQKLYSRFGFEKSNKEIEEDGISCAQELAELIGQAVLLKGSISVLSMPGHEPLTSGPGSVHLATAGTGDVLSGMIGALAAKFVAKNQELTLSTLRDIALIAVELHSKAADEAASRGEFGASAVCAAISEVSL